MIIIKKKYIYTQKMVCINLYLASVLVFLGLGKPEFVLIICFGWGGLWEVTQLGHVPSFIVFLLLWLPQLVPVNEQLEAPTNLAVVVALHLVLGGLPDLRVEQD